MKEISASQLSCVAGAVSPPLEQWQIDMLQCCTTMQYSYKAGTRGDIFWEAMWVGLYDTWKDY